MPPGKRESQEPIQTETQEKTFSESNKAQIREVCARAGEQQHPALVTMLVPAQVNYKPITAALDCGAEVTVISSDLYASLKLSLPLELVKLRGLTPGMITEAHLARNIPFTLGSQTFKIDMYVAPIREDLLLGMDFLHEHQVDILLSRNLIMIHGEEVMAVYKQYTNTKPITVGRITAVTRTVIPPHTVRYVKGKVTGDLTGTCLVVPYCSKPKLLLPFTATTVSDGVAYLPVTNFSNSTVTLKKHASLGTVEPVDVVEPVEGKDQPEEPPDPIQVRTATTETNSEEPPVEPEKKLTFAEVCEQMPVQMKDMFRICAAS